MLRHAREGPARCRTREAASIFPFRPQLPPNNVGRKTRSASAPGSDPRSFTDYTNSEGPPWQALRYWSR